jgi:hypothetical protein
MGQHSAETKSQRPDLLQPASVSCAQLDRTVFQQDQAIDIAAAHSHYWQWSKPDADGRFSYKNEIPWEIVEIFERHGFIWGGKWYHYDTMHFEYRPEILLAPN